MNCDDTLRLLISGPLTIAAAKHVNACGRCRGLMRALNAPVHADTPSPKTMDRLVQQLGANLRPVTPLPSPSYFTLSFGLLFLVAVSLLTYVWGVVAVPGMSASQITAIFAALAVSAGVLSNSLAHQMLPASRHRISPQMLPALIVLATAACITISFHFQDEYEFWRHAWICFRAGALAGATASLPLWLVLRRSAILSPAMTGATIGLFAGLVGTAALDMHCPILNAWHLLAGHLGPAAFCCLCGFILGLLLENRQYKVQET
jgi:hypothetical protein